MKSIPPILTVATKEMIIPSLQKEPTTPKGYNIKEAREQSQAIESKAPA